MTAGVGHATSPNGQSGAVDVRTERSPRGKPVVAVGPFDRLRCGFSVRTDTSVRAKWSFPLGQVLVGADCIWFTGPLGRRGWPLSRDGVSISRKMLGLSYTLRDRTLIFEVLPTGDGRLLGALRKFGWPMPGDS